MADINSGRGNFSLRRGHVLYEREVSTYRDGHMENSELTGKVYGLTLLHSISPAEAADITEKLGFSTNDAVEIYNRGYSAASREDYSKAIESFRRAVELDATLTDAIYNLAVCYERLRQVPQALSTWQTFVESKKRDAKDSDDVKFAKSRIDALKAGGK